MPCNDKKNKLKSYLKERQEACGIVNIPAYKQCTGNLQLIAVKSCRF